MEKDKPNYYAIITAEVRYDNNLTDSEKLLYGEITALANQQGYCWSSNKYFAKLYNVTKGTISKRISKLVDEGYLKRKVKRDENGKIIKRYLYPLNTIGYSEKKVEGMVNKNQDNTTSNNTTSNNKDIVEKEKIPFSDIVDYLNQRIGTKYRPSSKKTRRLIKARWNEGFRLDDFKTVIDKKAVEWIGDKQMEKYLRPPTLFGTKFESYLNQISVKSRGESKAQRLQELYGELEDGEETDF